jgi:hypothetical protein
MQILSKKPPLIDFAKLSSDCQNIIIGVEKLIDLTKSDIFMLENKIDLSIDEKKKLEILRIDAIYLASELEAKQQLYNEYLFRCEEQAEREIAELGDYTKNSYKVKMMANGFRNDGRLPVELRDHLKLVLNADNPKFDQRQKISFHLALKKEVELCNNYIGNSIK